VDEVERAKNRTKSKVRARVEHSIGVIKRKTQRRDCTVDGWRPHAGLRLVQLETAQIFCRRCVGRPTDEGGVPMLKSPTSRTSTGPLADGTHWVHCRPNFLLPVRVLSRLYMAAEGR